MTAAMERAGYSREVILPGRSKAANWLERAAQRPTRRSRERLLPLVPMVKQLWLPGRLTTTMPEKPGYLSATEVSGPNREKHSLKPAPLVRRKIGVAMSL
jgi:hypothetical protein